jgi:hypothetical protein
MSYASELGTFSITIKKKIYSLAIPTLIISVLSGICSFLLFSFFNSDAGGGQGTPNASPFESPYLTALFFVGIAFIGAFVIFLIFKYGNIKLLKALFATAVGLTSFFFVFMLIYTTPSYLLEVFYPPNTVFSDRTIILIWIFSITIGLLYAALTVVSMVYQLIPEPGPQIMAMLFAVLAGTFLAVFLPALAAILVMIGLSIYDIISVFRGPIKKIAEISEERYLENLEEHEKLQEENKVSKETTNTKELSEENAKESEDNDAEEMPTSRVADEEYIYADYIELGLGDLAFYGMLFSFALIRLGLFAAIASFFGVVIGAVITIKLLERVKMMPGLPMSVALGLIFAFTVWGILYGVGYEGWSWGWINPVWIPSL